MTPPIRILLADDHPVVRDGLAAILSTQPDFAVVGTAANGAEAVVLAQDLVPDVMLLDLAMPGMDGVAALQNLRAAQPGTRAIIFTAFDTDERIIEAVRAGAQGYLLKGAPREEIFNAIRVVHAGGSLLQPLVASKLLRFVRAESNGPQDRAGSTALTPREHEVLALLAQGLQNKEIAARLRITERTAKFHVSAILRKLGAANRTEALALATQRGLIH
ncbi:MAG TPA: response regulator transcription factor [Chloroflexia bacterium]|nr:response regulator transcription factor [Chloroflexia bacterium]